MVYVGPALVPLLCLVWYCDNVCSFCFQLCLGSVGYPRRIPCPAFVPFLYLGWLSIWYICLIYWRVIRRTRMHGMENFKQLARDFHKYVLALYLVEFHSLYLHVAFVTCQRNTFCEGSCIKWRALLLFKCRQLFSHPSGYFSLRTNTYAFVGGRYGLGRAVLIM